MFVHFRNKHDPYHFYGPAVLWFIVLILFTISASFLEYMWISIIAILVLLSPRGWEYWDIHKVIYTDPRTITWSWLEREIFTSEGFADKYDEYLGYYGMGLATLVYGGFYLLFS